MVEFFWSNLAMISMIIFTKFHQKVKLGNVRNDHRKIMYFSCKWLFISVLCLWQVVIVKCYHLFCNACIQRNLEIRHRKCPGCGTAFGQSDVRFVKIWQWMNRQRCDVVVAVVYNRGFILFTPFFVSFLFYVFQHESSSDNVSYWKKKRKNIWQNFVNQFN